MPQEIGALLWALLVTGMVLVLAYWFTRHVVGRTAVGRRARGNLTVLDQVSLGRDQRVVVVQAGEGIYLLGVTPGGITCLRVLSEEESAPWRPNQQDMPDQRTGFGEALRKVLEQRKR